MMLLCSEARRSPQSPEEEKAAKDILEILGGLPLALELAGAYLGEKRLVKFGDYLAKLKADPVKALEYKKLLSFTEHGPDLYSTLKINEELFSDDDGLLLRDILNLLAWSSPAHMGLSLMGKLLEKDESELRAALSIGLNYRLLYREQNLERYGIHRLVREVRRIEVPIAERVGWVDDICQRMGDWFEGLREEFENLPVFEAEIDHLKSWLKNAEGFSPSHTCRLIWLQAYPAYHRGLYHEAQAQVMQAVNLLSGSCLIDGILRANILDDLGATYSALGDYKKAQEYQERALKIRREKLGEFHLDTATSYDNIGFVYGELGEYEKALEHKEKALKIRREKLGEDHPYTASSYDTIGGTYRVLGEYKKALEYHETALKIRHEKLGEFHLDTSKSYNNIGLIYSELGEYKKALEYQEKALKIRREKLGEDHPGTATAYNNVGSAYAEFGEYKKALEYQEKALNIQLEKLGKDHPDTASSYNNMGATYNALDEHKKALDCQEKALKIFRDKLGEDHPYTATSYNNIGSTYGDLGEYKKALEYQEKALKIRREKLGEDHPDVGTLYVGLGRTYDNLHRPEEAIKSLQKAVSILGKALGDKHPSTINARKGLSTNRPGFRQQPKNRKAKKRK
jgi:tetratricopeptide (TPR) repeat protein